MKFYVISIILTVTALFVPVIQPAIAGAGEDTIAVSLESLESMDGDDAGGGNGMELPEGGGGSGGIPTLRRTHLYAGGIQKTAGGDLSAWLTL